MGHSVLILDGDMGLANVDVLLGLSPRANIADVLSGRYRLREILLEGPRGIKILPASSGLVHLTQLNEGEKIRLLEEFEDLEEEVDMVIIDTAAGISDNVLYFNLASQERILLLTPEPTSLTDVYALIKVLYRQYSLKNFHVVINCTQHPNQGRQMYRQLVTVVERFLGSISLNLMGILPLDRAVPRAVRAQRPFLELYPEARISQAIRDLAQALVQLQKSPVDGGLKFFGRKLLGVLA
jgi:flagellar biosynthesis protein FlhG